MNWNHTRGGSEISLGEMMSVIRHSRPSELLGVLGKLVGIGLLAVLIYSYCNVLIEACVHHVR